MYGVSGPGLRTGGLRVFSTVEKGGPKDFLAVRKGGRNFFRLTKSGGRNFFSSKEMGGHYLFFPIREGCSNFFLLFFTFLLFLLTIIRDSIFWEEVKILYFYPVLLASFINSLSFQYSTRALLLMCWPHKEGNKIYWNRGRATRFYESWKKLAPRDFFL